MTHGGKRENSGRKNFHGLGRVQSIVIRLPLWWIGIKDRRNLREITRQKKISEQMLIRQILKKRLLISKIVPNGS